MAENNFPTPTRLGESEIFLSSRRPPDPPPRRSTDNDRLQLFWATLPISKIWSAATLGKHTIMGGRGVTGKRMGKGVRQRDRRIRAKRTRDKEEG